MRRFGLIMTIVLGIPVVYLAAHLLLIEAGREVITVSTLDSRGSTLRTRLWIVDEDAHAWIHGNRNAAWVRNLMENPLVEIERGGERRPYRAELVPGPHQNVHELLREKYGVADWWVRLISNEDEAVPVRLTPL